MVAVAAATGIRIIKTKGQVSGGSAMRRAPPAGLMNFWHPCRPCGAPTRRPRKNATFFIGNAKAAITRHASQHDGPAVSGVVRRRELVIGGAIELAVLHEPLQSLAPHGQRRPGLNRAGHVGLGPALAEDVYAVSGRAARAFDCAAGIHLRDARTALYGEPRHRVAPIR